MLGSKGLDHHNVKPITRGRDQEIDKITDILVPILPYIKTRRIKIRNLNKERRSGIPNLRDRLSYRKCRRRPKRLRLVVLKDLELPLKISVLNRRKSKKNKTRIVMVRPNSYVRSTRRLTWIANLTSAKEWRETDTTNQGAEEEMNDLEIFN